MGTALLILWALNVSFAAGNWAVFLVTGDSESGLIGLGNACVALLLSREKDRH